MKLLFSLENSYPDHSRKGLRSFNETVEGPPRVHVCHPLMVLTTKHTKGISFRISKLS